jgi:hypothetical protein
MQEIIFLVEEDPDGSYFARALGASIFTQAGNWAELLPRIKDAVECHFDDNGPESIYIYHLREKLTMD